MNHVKRKAEMVEEARKDGGGIGGGEQSCCTIVPGIVAVTIDLG